jgi:hypothetical protein
MLAGAMLYTRGHSSSLPLTRLLSILISVLHFITTQMLHRLLVKLSRMPMLSRNIIPAGPYQLPKNHSDADGGVQVEDTKICVIMVGLPARGKSLIAGKGSSMLNALS